MTIETKFDFLQKVWVIPFSCWGIITQVNFLARGIEYTVRYHLDYKLNYEQFMESELSSEKS